ncbi:hypothetical protein LCGC14_2573660, partial [marine sediment metagenome]
FLDSADLEAAQQAARSLPVGDRPEDPDALAERARDAEAAQEPEFALRLLAEALSVSDTPELWAQSARVGLAMADGGAQEAAGALQAATNAYLRSDDPALRARTLDLMALALERLGRGEAAVQALRLATGTAPDAGLEARLAQLEAQYGFRVIDHDIESDGPRPRICVRFSDPLVAAGTDYTGYLGIAADGLSVTPEGDRLCLAGVSHGTRYRLTLRAGLPAASGETLSRSVEIAAYVRDRPPTARFPGQGYVLPAHGEVALPIVGINLPEVALVLRRISDRNLVRTLREDLFAGPVPQYRQDIFESEISEVVWRGHATLGVELNSDVTTRLPLERQTGPLEPGVYALQARVPDTDPYDTPMATQWFVVSDLGITTLEGADGLHVFVRSLATTGPLEGVELTLISQANAILGAVYTDAAGRANFGPGLMQGTGSMECG